MDRRAEHQPTIGLLIDSIEYQHQQEILYGIADFAREHHINFLCFEGGCIQSKLETDHHKNHIFQLVDSSNVDGLIITTASIGHFVKPELIREFCDRFHPLPMVSISMELDQIPSIHTDNTIGFKSLLNHLITDHHFRKFAFIKGPATNQDANERFQVFQQVLAESNIPVNPKLIGEGQFTFQSGIDAVRNLLETKSEIDVIIASNDDMAFGALQELKARKIKVPEDIAIVGFDDLYQGGYLTPSLTTVQQSFYEEGKTAAKLILDQIQHQKVNIKTILPTTLIIRDSCGCYSELITQAAIHGKTIQPRAELLLIDKHRQILGEIIEKTTALNLIDPGGEIQCLIKQVLDALFDELRHPKTPVFLAQLAACLRQASMLDHNLFRWQAIISQIRLSVLPELTDPQMKSHAEDLWHQARIIIGEMAILNLKSMNHRHLENSEILDIIREELSVILDIQHLKDSIIKWLPQLGIHLCYLSVFENQSSLNHDAAKLALAFNQNNDTAVEGRDVSFNPRQLFPQNLPGLEEPYSMIVLSLHFDQSNFGFVLLEMNLNNVGVYNSLRRILSYALQGVFLFNQAREDEKLRITQQEHLKNVRELKKVIEGFIKTIALTVEKRDPYTAGHQLRVSELACAIAGAFNLPAEQTEAIRMASIVHDLGKIYIPADILNKPGRLKDIEFNLIKVHPRMAHDILSSYEFPWPLSDIIIQHHERMNGSGYPAGLKGGEIMIEARIIAVADVVEAMCSQRPHRPPLGIEAALAELTTNRGILYDPAVVDICLDLFENQHFQFQNE